MSNVVQATPVVSGAPTAVATFGANPVAGRSIIVVVRTDSSGPAVISGAGGTVAEVGTFVVIPGSVNLRAYLIRNITGGATSVTVTYTGSSILGIQCFEVIADVNPLDQTNTGTGTSNTPTTASITTGQANTTVLVVAALGAAATFSAGTGFTLQSASTALNLEDQTLSAITTLAGAFGLSSSVAWAARILSLKYTPQGGGGLALRSAIYRAGP